MDKLYLWIAYALIAIFVMFTLISYVNNQFTNSGFIRDYAARDISLFFDAIQSAKWQLNLDYNVNTLKFEVGNNYVYLEDFELNAISKYPYTTYNSEPFNFDKELILCKLNFNYDNNLIIKEGECS